MKVTHCDICGKEMKSNSLWLKNSFYDMNVNGIEDVCVECYQWIHCCINMMKETGWRPDFHEKLKSENIWESDKAGYVLEDLKADTGLELFRG